MNDFVHLFSSLKRAYAYRHEPEQMQVLAAVYWDMLLTFIVILVGVAVVLGGCVFLYSIERLSGGAANSNVQTILDKEKLIAVLDAFKDRTDQYESVQQLSAIADPSK